MPQPPISSEVQGGEVPLNDLLREDGTLDLNRARDGRVDLDGFQVTMDADGQLRARSDVEETWLPSAGSSSLDNNGKIFALVTAPDGVIYAGGEFASAGGITRTRNIARWTPNESGGGWSALGTEPLATGLNAGVRALAWGPDGALYVGGDFTYGGGDYDGSYIVRWTPDDSGGGAWSALGTGLTGLGTTDAVTALAWGPDGALYVGGRFRPFGGSSSGPTDLLRWTPDASGEGTWSTIEADVNGWVFSLAWGPDGALYVGGAFTSVGGVSWTRNVARWTPNEEGDGTWSSVSTNVNDTVRVLKWGPDGSLYAGGDFTWTGGVAASRVARWTPNGSGGGMWRTLGAGVDNTVSALAWGPDGALYVGGEFQSAGDVWARGSARWMPEGNSGTWSALGSGVFGKVQALAWGEDQTLYAGGHFQHAGSTEETRHIARWTPNDDDGTWSALGTGLSGSVHTLAWGPDGALYAGGHFTSAGGVPGADRVARWTPDGGDGGAWSALGTGVNSEVFALAWGPDGALYVGGNFTAAGEVWASRIARWTPDGTDGAWSILGIGVAGRRVNELVWGPDGALYVGGEFTSAGGVPGTSNIARWTPDGSGGGSWSALGTGMNSTVWALTWGPDGALYSGGHFTAAGDVLANRIARWTPNGSGGGVWGTLGAGVDNTVSALAWGPDGALYVGGSFTSAGEVSANRIARWTLDGSGGGSWSVLGTGVNSSVWALAWGPNGALYVGGTFIAAGGILADRVAQWTPNGGDGTWSTLESGMNSIVSALEWGPENVLYVGGDFTEAGGKPSARFARWQAAKPTVSNEGTSEAELVQFGLMGNYPNPFTTRTTLVFSVATPADVHLAVYDVLGRRVATLAEEHVGAGTHERVFDGSGLSNGTYLVRLSSGATSQTRRVLLLR